ncbi:PREDICTED: zinc finger protein JACKDAW-like isoform X2 [Tarenaya hassleriana]|uniref:zinc finger protein JACKDAW-like isoform X2 n=1 Tax=Tarenaya hassleriana TaxID=28532 RepID=UPI00053C4B3D|nr:PREDICTED: zinc finger protein JACKDAW-like isoform X2 [Tarenaya hassleriana]
MQMIPGDPFSLSSSMAGFAHHQEPQLHHLQQQNPDLNPNPNPNLNPNPNAKPNPSSKKKRNQPDPDAEVIALSPKTLMATNRFVCEICNKGFQRDQNLQLHRRGHNLPWKLRQRTNKEAVRKKVYICPIKTCVHHDPSRALGDLTGIKKHYSRKHGEKKWKCEKCSKKYAVQSDWKAHTKTCGTREYKCDCGTLFSRKDSFITHRAFCDALTEESARMSSLGNNNSGSTNLNFGNDSNNNNNNMNSVPHGFINRSVHHPDISSAINHQFGLGFGHDLTGMHAHGLSEMVQMSSAGNHHLFPPPPSSSSSIPEFAGHHHHFQIPATSTNPNLTLSSSSSASLPVLQNQQTLKDASPSPLFSSSDKQQPNKPISPMSATALLQKAAQMGSTRSTATAAPSFFAGSMTSSSAASPSSSSPPPPPRNPIMIHHQMFNPNPRSINHQEHHNLAPPPPPPNMSTATSYAAAAAPNPNPGYYPIQQMGMTRDFLGVSSEHHLHHQMGRQFLPQELTRFAPLG